MDLLVTIHCNDNTIKISVNELLQFEYFNKMLSGFNTKIIREEKTIEENNIKYTVYTHKIPEINVECSEKVLKELMKGYGYDADFSNDKDFLIELMQYSDMFQIYKKIEYRSWDGFRVSDHFSFVYYVKEKLPYINPFVFIDNSGFCFSTIFIEYGYKLLADNKLDNKLAHDLLEILKEWIFVERISPHKTKFQLDIIKSIRQLYNLYGDEIEKIITNQLLNELLCKYTQHKPGKDWWGYKEAFNKYIKHIDNLFDEFEKLEEIGLIKLNEIGCRDDYY